MTLAAALHSFHQQGALVSINHPVLDVGDLCIGCAWKHDSDPAQIDAVEIATTGWDILVLEETPPAPARLTQSWLWL